MFESLDLDSEKKNFEDIFPCTEETALAIDLLKHCLVFTPSKRFTIQEVLEHPFFEEFHDDDKESECMKLTKNKAILDDNSHDFAIKRYKEEISKIVKIIHKKIRRDRRERE